MRLEEIRALVQPDLACVDQVIRDRLQSAVPLVDQIAGYIVSGRGKRLRPLLVVLAGRACGHNGHNHIEAAAVIELIHTATLLHDDVVDGSSMRRVARSDFANSGWARACHQINNLGHRCECRLATSLHVHKEMKLPLLV